MYTGIKITLFNLIPLSCLSVALPLGDPHLDRNTSSLTVLMIPTHAAPLYVSGKIPIANSDESGIEFARDIVGQQKKGNVVTRTMMIVPTAIAETAVEQEVEGTSMVSEQHQRRDAQLVDVVDEIPLSKKTSQHALGDQEVNKITAIQLMPSYDPPRIHKSHLDNQVLRTQERLQRRHTKPEKPRPALLQAYLDAYSPNTEQKPQPTRQATAYLDTEPFLDTRDIHVQVRDPTQVDERGYIVLHSLVIEPTVTPSPRVWPRDEPAEGYAANVEDADDIDDDDEDEQDEDEDEDDMSSSPATPRLRLQRRIEEPGISEEANPEQDRFQFSPEGIKQLRAALMDFKSLNIDRIASELPSVTVPNDSTRTELSDETRNLQAPHHFGHGPVVGSYETQDIDEPPVKDLAMWDATRNRQAPHQLGHGPVVIEMADPLTLHERSVMNEPLVPGNEIDRADEDDEEDNELAYASPNIVEGLGYSAPEEQARYPKFSEGRRAVGAATR